MFDKALFTLKGIRLAYALLALLAALFAGATIGQAWALSTALVNLWYGNPPADQLFLAAAFALFFMGRQVIRYAQETYMETYATQRSAELREELLRAVFTGGPTLIAQHGTGNVTTAALEGVTQVETYIRLMLPKMMNVVVVPLILLICAFFYDWVSGLIMLVVFPFIIWYMALLGRTAKSAADAQHGRFRIMSNHFIDSLRGLTTLQLLGRSKQHGEQIFAVSEQFRESTMKTLRVAILSGTVMDLFSTFSLAAVAMMLGFRLVDGTIAFLPALFVLVLVPEYFKPIREFASDYHASLNGKTALASILNIIESGAKKPAADLPPLPAQSDVTLALCDVCFTYPDGHRALQDVNFAFTGCKKIGIIGASGSGKSTLINVLGGFATPESGAVELNGERLESLNAPAWQQRVIYIPQNPYIFHATLRENITFYCPDATEETVWHAVDAMGLRPLVEELPQGLDTLIGEGGRTLSGGQAQRIALARAMVDESRSIVLFDEPTAHLDIETELELKERMLPFMEDKLVFFATHRLHWTPNMDEILQMENGRVVSHTCADAHGGDAR